MANQNRSTRLLGLLHIGVVAVIGTVACAESGPPQLEACVGAPRAPARTVPAAPRKPFIGVLHATPNSPTVLARLDPLSLRPVSRKVNVGEYHDAWSLSPDGSHLALGVSSGESVLSPSRRLRARIGVYIVDLEAMELVREVQTGVAAEALAWLAPRRLVASLQRGGTVLVDPLTGKILKRWLGFSFPDASALSRNGLVMLLPKLRLSSPRLPLTRVTGATRLAVVDAGGRLRSVILERIRLAVHSRNSMYYEDHAGLTVDPARSRAYVFAADAPVAEVDLRTMRVSYHRLESLFLRPDELGGRNGQPKSAPLARERRALWAGNGQVVVFGRDFVAEGSRKEALVPAGATLVDTAKWSACILNTRATGAASVGNVLVVYGGRLLVSRAAAGIGLRAFTARGGKFFHLFDEEQVWDVQVASGRAYVRTPDALHVVDARSGKAVSEIAPPPELVGVITRPS